MADNGAFWIVMGLGGIAAVIYANSTRVRKPVLDIGARNPLEELESELAGGCLLQGNDAKCHEYSYLHDLNTTVQQPIAK